MVDTTEQPAHEDRHETRARDREPVGTSEELTELRAIKQRLEERIQSLGLDAHIHGRELRMLDEILGEA